MDRIAKIIARAGVCSRRDAEKLITEGRVTYQNKIIDNPAMKFPNIEEIKVDGKALQNTETKLWLYHKPVGLVVSHKDEKGRSTIFDQIPIDERVISIGRLDKNTSGLLLLTNDGEFARKFELPANKIERVYLIRIFGKLDFSYIKRTLSRPIRIEQDIYQPIEVIHENSRENNHWLKVILKEGKNREIRKVFDFLGYKISRLIRIKYGPYELGKLEPGELMPAKVSQTK